MEQQTELLQKLGKLAKLEVSEADETLKNDFKKIVAYMDVIREVDTTGVKPLQLQKNIMECNVFREDEPILEEVRFCRKELLNNAPKTEQGYFVVPKTVTEGSLL